MKIVVFGDADFRTDWLQLVKHDPVHPGISIAKRISGNRTIFVFAHDDEPQFMICARFGNRLPHNMAEVLNDDGYNSKYDVTYAIFYSVFRLPNANLKGAGKKAYPIQLHVRGSDKLSCLGQPAARDWVKCDLFVEIAQ